MTAALSREVTAARQAMELSAMGTDEYRQALDWLTTAEARLLAALGGNTFRPSSLLYRLAWAGCKPKRPCLTFFPALRRVHRPGVA